MRRRMISAIHVLALGVFVTPHCAGASDPVVVEGNVLQGDERPRDLGWNSGTLRAVLENAMHIPKDIEIRFTGERKGSLQQLTVSTNAWKLNLEDYVARLKMPIANRITIVTGRWTKAGEINELGISLPYLDISADGTDKCMTLELTIFAGRVTSNERFAAEPERCRR